MAGRFVVKVIQVPPPGSRRLRRCENKALYPAVYSNAAADLDIWHQMFLQTHFKRLTMHPFTTPPDRVLDLGCGTGYWAIDASKQWKDSKITGFDIKNIQPRFFQGVKWVNGDFRDKLPFPSESFDFVRMACLGLAIPEDEWQYVLEEVRRVMKHGAILEIIEEDLLFPCASTLLRIPAPAPLYHRTTQKRQSRLNSILFTPDAQSTTSTSGYSSTFSKTDSLLPSGICDTPLTSVSDLSHRAFAFPEESPRSEHPQDHTRLKISWDAMLATRFLAPKLVNVIPFYLSTAFVSTTQHIPLEIALPPSSGTPPPSPSPPALQLRQRTSRASVRSKGHERKGAGMFNIDADYVAAAMSMPIPIPVPAASHSAHSLCQPQPPTPKWGTMHLAKTVSTVKSCKEAIWEEYKVLYTREALEILSRTAPKDEDYVSQPKQHVARAAFEIDWRNWELDMEDRVAMRSNMTMLGPWSLSQDDVDRSPCSLWRDKLERKSSASVSPSEHLVTPWNPKDLCKSMRVFTTVKT